MSGDGEENGSPSGKRGGSADKPINLDVDSDEEAPPSPPSSKRGRSPAQAAGSNSSPSFPELSSDSDSEEYPRKSSTTSLSTPSTTGALHSRMRDIEIIDLSNSDDGDDEDDDFIILEKAPLRKKKRRSRSSSSSGDEGRDGDDEGPGRPGGSGGRSKGKRRASTEDEKKEPKLLYPKYTKYTLCNWPAPEPDHVPDEDDLDGLKLFQRFVILAVLRWHDVPEAHQKAVITRPYLQIPYEIQLKAVRQVAHGLWNGSRCSAGIYYHELINRPIDRLTYCGHGDICTMCHRRRGDRIGLHQYHVEGRPYDDDTFAAKRGGEWREYDWQLGSTCWEPITGGHQTYHQMFTTFHSFERNHIATIEAHTPLWKRLQDADIDALVRHFLVEIIPPQFIHDILIRGPISVFDDVMNDIRGRTEAERTRRIKAVEREEDRIERRLQRNRGAFRRQ